MKLRSSIKPELLRRALFRGILLSAPGAFLLLLTGTLFPEEKLAMWGLPIVILGFLFIALGLLPYRRLCRLELKPYELLIVNESLLISKEGKPLYEIPVHCIEKIGYLEEKTRYGIEIFLKESEGLFLPYFTRRACQELKTCLDDIMKFDESNDLIPAVF